MQAAGVRPQSHSLPRLPTSQQGCMQSARGGGTRPLVAPLPPTHLQHHTDLALAPGRPNQRALRGAHRQRAA